MNFVVLDQHLEADTSSEYLKWNCKHHTEIVNNSILEVLLTKLTNHYLPFYFMLALKQHEMCY